MHGLRGGGVVKATHSLLLQIPIFWLPWHRFPILGGILFKKLKAEPEAPPPPPPPPKKTLRDYYFKVVETLTLLFPVWTVLLQGLAFYRPQTFNWLSTSPISIGERHMPVDLYSLFLMIIMFSMGTTLTFNDFSGIKSSAWPISVAFILQYGLTPLLGLLIGRFLKEEDMATGLLVLACSPGSQASNVACFIAGCDLPVSILMTLVSTMLSGVMTPLLLRVFLGAKNVFDGFSMANKVVKVTLAPIALGLVANEYLPDITAQIKPISPLVMVVLTSCLCATPIAGVAAELKSQSNSFLPVVSLQTLAFVGGYLIPKYLLDMGEKMARTISIETGMQSAALGYLLATQHFPNNPLAAVPSAVSLPFRTWGCEVGLVFRPCGCGSDLRFDLAVQRTPRRSQTLKSKP